MKIEVVNPETGEVHIAENTNINNLFIDWSSRFEMSDANIKKIIDNLDISADKKSLIYSFSKATIKAGEFFIKIGRKVIDLVCKLFTDYPSASFGLIFGAIAGFLVTSIPLLSGLASIITPILLAFGLTKGLSEDLKDKALSRKIAVINGQFSPLHT